MPGAGQDPVRPRTISGGASPADKAPPTREQAAAAVVDTFQDRCRRGYAEDVWFRQNTSGLRMQDGLWYRGEQIVVPEATVDGIDLRQHCISEHHDSLWAGHFGVLKTTRAIMLHFWWPGMRTEVIQFVRSCGCCQRNKSSNTAPAGLLHPLPVPALKWDSVTMDLITCLPKSAKGHDAIVVFVDRLTKMVHFQPCSTTCTGLDLASMFMWQVFRLHGMPKEIISDRDPRLMSDLWQSICSMLNVKHRKSTAFHPQTDGQTERVNRVLEEVLRHFVNPNQNNWDDLLPTAEFAINSAYHESIKTTPFYLTYGCVPRTPLTVHLESKTPAAQDFVREAQVALQRVKDTLYAAQRRYKALYDQKRRDVELKVGEKVLLNTKNIKFTPSSSRKLMPRWIGPYEIVKVVNPVAYKLSLPGPMQRLHDVFHISLLKPFVASDRTQAEPPPLDVEGELEWEVEALVRHRFVRSKLEYFVHWVGYDYGHHSWEPEENLTNCAELVQEYWDGNPQEEISPGVLKKARQRLLQQPT